jgi:gas vesicle structural protein
MTTAVQQRRGGYVDRPSPSGLADVVELILDKGLVIDAYVRVSLVGIELLTIDARIVIASVDTYLRFAEATNRLDLYDKGGKDLPELMESMTEGGAKGKTRGALSGAKDKVSELIGSDDDDDEDEDSRPRRRPRARQAAQRRRPRSQDDE